VATPPRFEQCSSRAPRGRTAADPAVVAHTSNDLAEAEPQKALASLAPAPVVCIDAPKPEA